MYLLTKRVFLGKIKNMKKIQSENDLIDAVNEYGILTFWDEVNTSAWTLSGVDFNTLWYIRESAANSRKIAYGKFMRKKSTFVCLDLFPALVALRRDGYDFDSLADEGLCPNKEKLIMDNVMKSGSPVPSYSLGKELAVKGYDSAITSLQNKTYLCLTFKKSYMGTALLNMPENVFGRDFIRSAYAKPTIELVAYLKQAKGLSEFTDTEVNKILSKAV